MKPIRAFTASEDPSEPAPVGWPRFSAISEVQPLERKQLKRVQAVREARDEGAVEKTLANLRGAAATQTNVMPLLLETARAHATEGEIVGALQQVWGDYREQPVF